MAKDENKLVTEIIQLLLLEKSRYIRNNSNNKLHYLLLVLYERKVRSISYYTVFCPFSIDLIFLTNPFKLVNPLRVSLVFRGSIKEYLDMKFQLSILCL